MRSARQTTPAAAVKRAANQTRQLCCRLRDELRGDGAHDAEMRLDGCDATDNVLLGSLHGIGVEQTVDAVNLGA